MQDRLTAVFPRHLDGGTGADYADDIAVNLQQRFQQTDLVLWNPHMGTVQTLRFAHLVQTEAVDHNVCHSGQLQCFLLQGIIGFTVSLITTVHAHNLQTTVFCHLFHRLQLRRIDHGGTGTLVSRLHDKITDQGYFCPLFQRQDLFFIL